MAVEELVRRVGEGVSRRRFFTRIGTVALGATYGILGLPQPAHALVCRRCCCLCHSPSSGSPCGAQGPACIWSWTCCAGNGNVYRCSEWYCNVGADCDANCGGVQGSTIEVVGTCSSPNPCC